VSRFALARTLEALTLFAGVLIGSFLLFRVAPGDTARTILGPNASQEAVARLRRDLGTDQPLHEQIRRQVVGALRLDLGRSAIDGRDVASEVVAKFGVTTRLAALSSGISLFLSYAFSFAAFRLRAPWLTYVSRVGAVTPTYCSGVLAALAFGVLLPWAPLSGYGADGDRWSALFLPAAVAALYPLAAMTAILSERIREASEEGFARTAAAYGMTRSAVFHHTLLPAIWIPWAAAWVNQLSVVFVAGFVLEVIFTIPGTGILLVQAIQQKDYPMLQGILLLNASFFITVSWLAALSFRAFDPRLRQGG
jgi:peptide/nickel transport system permease protein